MAIKKSSAKHKDAKTPKHKHELEIKDSRFSKKNLIVFAVIFAAIGGFAIWRAFAIPAAPRIIIDDGIDGCTSSMTCPPRDVPVGHTSQLSWNWDRAYRQPTYCNDNFSGGHHQVEYGPFAYTFNGGGTFYWTVNCYVSDPSDFDEVTMQFNVIPPPTCSPASQTVYTNQAASLVAGYGNGSYAWSAPGGNPPSGSGYNFYPAYAATGAHTVTVTSFGMSTNCTVNVINPPPGAPSVTLSPHTATINQGQSVTLGWLNNVNTVSCPSASPAGWPGTTRVNSSKSVSPRATTSYSLTCVNSIGVSRTDTATITVRGTTAQRPTVRLVASPSSIPYNGYTYLQWSSTNATTCSAGWTGSHATSGNQQVGRLTRTTTYSITCTGAGGSRSASVTVHVGAPPTNCPPNCPTPPPPAAPTQELAPPAPEPIIEEEPTDNSKPACTNKNNHLINILVGGLVGELINLLKHHCGS